MGNTVINKSVINCFSVYYLYRKSAMLAKKISSRCRKSLFIRRVKCWSSWVRNPCVQRFLRKMEHYLDSPIGLLLTVSIQDIQRYSRFLLILSYQYLFSCGQIKKAWPYCNYNMTHTNVWIWIQKNTCTFFFTFHEARDFHNFQFDS